MKLLYPLLFLVIFSSASMAQPSIFYEISGDDIATSYLLATLPTKDERTFNLSDSVFWAFDRVDALGVMRLYDTLEQDRLEAAIRLGNDVKNTDFINNKIFGQLDRLTLQLKDKAIWDYERWPPLYLRDRLQRWLLQQEEGQSITHFFENLASNQGKSIVSPLHMKDWAGVYQNIPLAVQADMLVHYLHLKDNDKRQKRILNQFIAGHLDKLKRLEQTYRHSEQFHAYYQPLTDQLTKRIGEQSGRQSTFYLVEASMLGGENGLLEQLRQGGYNVRPVGRGFNYKKDESGAVKGLVTFSDTTIFEPTSSIQYYELNNDFQDAYFNKIIPGWYKLTSYRGGFSIRMPGPPEIIKDKLPAEAGGMKMYLYRYEDSRDRNLYLVSFFDYPREAEVKGTDDFFQRVISQTVQRFNGLLLKERNISTDQYKGREIEMQGQDNMIIRVRFYLIGNRLYQVVLSAEDRKAYSKINQAFFNSFKILDVYRRPWFKVNTGLVDVAFPNEVNSTTQQMAFKDTVATNLRYSLTSTPTNLQYSANITMLPEQYKFDDAFETYHRVAYETIDQIEGVLVDEGYMETKDYRGWYLEVGGKQEQMIRTRIFLSKRTLIQLMVFGPEDSVRSSFADRFLNGYQLHSDYR